MSMKVKLSNTPATELEYIEAREEPIYYEGSNRRCLIIYFDPTKVSLSQVNDLASVKANLKTLTFVNDNNPNSVITNIYDEYTIKIKVSQETVTRGNDLLSGDEIRVEQIILQLGKTTRIEQQLEALGIVV